MSGGCERGRKTESLMELRGMENNNLFRQHNRFPRKPDTNPRSAASPALDTMMESAIPTVSPRICSNISGMISALSARPVKSCCSVSILCLLPPCRPFQHIAFYQAFFRQCECFDLPGSKGCLRLISHTAYSAAAPFPSVSNIRSTSDPGSQNPFFKQDTAAFSFSI